VSYTPGALRAGKNISERFRRALPKLPDSNAETLAAIIDAETAAPEMLEALKTIESCLAPDDNDSAAQKVRAAIAKAEAK